MYNTPIYDFLMENSKKNDLRCYMPGHKGKAPISELNRLYELDITEICGADSLFEANGIIAESERQASLLYGSAATFFSAGGSTLGIQSMLAIMKSENRTVIAARNVHRAFLNAAALLDLDVKWLYPKYSGGILTGELDLNTAEKLLKECEKPACIYVTSPDYTGRMADIDGLSLICKKYDARLLVDNAHGAHLAFFEKSCHPISLGADLCCDSAHKMLPALTGAAYIHTSRAEYASVLKQTMTLFASTSPSYLIMMSLDLCNRYIAEHIRDDIKSAISYIERLKSRFADKLLFAESEPFHITVKAAESGINGIELSELLRKYGVECEYADTLYTIMLMSPVSSSEDFERLENALKKALCEVKPFSAEYSDFSLPIAQKAMSIRNAVFSTSEELNVENSEGRICSAVKVPCPPAVPIAVSGEIITKECINIFKRYGVLTVNVVK